MGDSSPESSGDEALKANSNPGGLEGEAIQRAIMNAIEGGTKSSNHTLISAIQKETDVISVDESKSVVLSSRRRRIPAGRISEFTFVIGNQDPGPGFMSRNQEH